VLRQGLAGKIQAQFIGEEQIEDKKALAVDWVLSSGGEGQPAPERVRLYFDPETRLLIGARFRQPGPQGFADVLQVWSDFRLVQIPGEGSGAGLKFPYFIRTYRNAAKYSVIAVEEVKLNTKPDPVIFTKLK